MVGGSEFLDGCSEFLHCAKQLLYLFFGHKNSPPFLVILYHEKADKSSIFNGLLALKHVFLTAFPDCLFRCDLQALHQPAEGLRIQLPQLRFAARPLEAAVVQALIQEDISITGKVQRLDPIRSPAAEQEEAFLIQFCAVLMYDDLGQTVDPAAQVCIAAGDIVVADPAQINHGVGARSAAQILPAGQHFPAASAL